MDTRLIFRDRTYGRSEGRTAVAAAHYWIWVGGVRARGREIRRAPPKGGIPSADAIFFYGGREGSERGSKKSFYA